nr:probable cytochrome P450 313a4 [Aedes albopictus]
MWWYLLVPYICVGVSIVVSYIQWTRRKMYKTLASMSCPKKWPFIGHAHKFFNATPESIADGLKYFAEFPSPVCIHLGPFPQVGIFDAEQARIVLNSPNCLDKAFFYDFLQVPGTLISAPGHLWKPQRKALNSSLGPAILGSFVPIFNKASATLVDLLEKHVGEPERDFSHEIAKCFLDQIYVTAFGCDFSMQTSPEGDKTVNMMNDYMHLLTKRFFSFWLYPDCIDHMTDACQTRQALLKAHHDITENIVRQNKVRERMNMADEQYLASVNSYKQQNFIECLVKYMRTSNHSTQDDIYSHIDMTLFAGNDTTAKSLNYILLMMAMHPDVQERCYQEVMEICPDEAGVISAENATSFTYLDMVCKESMRLFPVVPIMARATNADIKLSDDHTIPANCNIILGIYQMHRDPKVWGPNADRFDPDNFLPERVAKRHPYAYLPFSAGPRNCMGLRYARISMKIMAAHILKKYRLKTTLTLDQVRVSYGVMLNIANGVLLSLERR